MSGKSGTPFKDRFNVRINEKAYKVATPDEVRAATSGRAWTTRQKSSQGGDGERFTIAIRDFSTGAGFSHDGPAGTYCYARGFDCSTPGEAVTWPHLVEGDSFLSTDVRGWQFRVGQYLYVARGRYVCKYLINPNSAGVNWPIIERHDLAAGTVAGDVIAGRPEVFAGKAYVPVRTGATGALERYHQLTTVSTFDAEIQTITISGTPTSGTYTISWNGSTSAAIAYNAGQAAVQAALRAIPGLEQVTVVTTGSTPNFTHTVTMTGAGGALGTASPPQMTNTDGTSGGAHAIAHATTHAGTSDTWTRAAAALMAKCFRRYGIKLQRGQGNTAAPGDYNRVYAVEGDPMTAGDWNPAAGAGYEFGDNAHEVNDMADFGSILVVGKSDGVYSLDPSFQSQALLPDFVNFVDDGNCIGMETGLGLLLVPMISGLVSFDGVGFDVIGPDQEKRLNARIDRGVGRFASLAVGGGGVVYYTANDGFNVEGILGSFRLPQAGQPRKMIFHQHEIEGGRYENVILLPSTSEPAAPKTPSTWSDDATVGTLAWSSPSNAAAEDDTAATASGTGTTHYLKGLSPQPNIPSDATILGIVPAVKRRGWSTLTKSQETNGGYASSQNATYNTARSGGGTLAATNAPATALFGQSLIGGVYTYYLAYLDFDTSAIPDTAEVLSVALGVYATVASPGETAAAVQARLYDFGATVTTADMIAGASLAALPLLATADATLWQNAPVAVPFTSEALFATNINRTGNTRIVLCTDAQVVGTAPASGTNPRQIYLSGAGGNYPTLVVRYKDIVDGTIKMVKVGAIAGNNLASAAQWPGAFDWAEYGGASDLLGTTWTPAQANDATTGMVISATSTGAGTFEVDTATITWYYTVPGQSDVATLLSVLAVSADRTTVHPKIWQLPRNGQTVGNDPLLSLARDNALLQLTRYSGPGRNLEKAYDTVIFWAEMSASNGTGPGLTVEYTLDDEHWASILDANGAALEVGAALGAAGAGTVVGYFPRTDTWTHGDNGTIGIRFVLAAKTGAQVDSSVRLRDIEISGWYRPRRVGEFSITLTLADELLIEGGIKLISTVQQQIAELESCIGPRALPVPYQSPADRDGYAVIRDVEFREGLYADGDRQIPIYVAKVVGEWAS